MACLLVEKAKEWSWSKTMAKKSRKQRKVYFNKNEKKGALMNMQVDEVSLVDKGANRLPLILIKNETEEVVETEETVVEEVVEEVVAEATVDASEDVQVEKMHDGSLYNKDVLESVSELLNALASQCVSLKEELMGLPAMGFRDYCEMYSGDEHAPKYHNELDLEMTIKANSIRSLASSISEHGDYRLYDLNKIVKESSTPEDLFTALSDLGIEEVSKFNTIIEEVVQKNKVSFSDIVERLESIQVKLQKNEDLQKTKNIIKVDNRRTITKMVKKPQTSPIEAEANKVERKALYSYADDIASKLED